MGKRAEFIEEFGEELFDEFFSVVYGDMESDRIAIEDVHFKDAINQEGTGTLYLEDGREVKVHFEDGDWDGSQILDYGESIENLKKTQVVCRFELDEDRIKEEDIGMMRNLFEAKKDEIEEKERAYNYDRQFSPGGETEAYYKDWMERNHIKRVFVEIEVG